MPQQQDKKLTPSDLDPIMEMHKDLKQTLQSGMNGLQVEMQTLNVTQAGLARDVEYIKEAQGKQEGEIDRIRRTQLSCPSSTGFVGTMKRIGRLERFRDRALEAGVLKQTPIPAIVSNTSSELTERRAMGLVVTNPKFLNKALRISMTLLLGAAVGGALLALALFLN